MSTDDALKGHELFRSLNVEETDRLSRFSSVKKLAANEVVFKTDQAGSHVYMLMKGSVNLRLSTDPADLGIIVSRIKLGELFGLSPLLDSPKYTTTALCSEPTEVLAIEARPFRDLLSKNCPVAIDVLNRVARIYFARYLDILKNLQAVVNQIPLAR